jgi:hypothetical protein
MRFKKRVFQSQVAAVVNVLIKTADFWFASPFFRIVVIPWPYHVGHMLIGLILLGMYPQSFVDSWITLCVASCFSFKPWF